MIKRVVLFLMILLLSLPTPVLAAEAGNGVIDGKLVNGTAGGSSVADQTVTLTTYLNDTESGTQTAKSRADGQFVFNGLSTASGYAYELKVTYQEADYTSERVSFTASETTRAMTLTVYDATDSDAVVKVSAAHTIAYLGDGELEVVEYLVFTNNSDRAYIGTGEITTTGTRRTLKLPLPAKTTELQYGGDLMSCCVLQDPNGLFDTMAVLPGEKLIAYSYKVPYKAGAYEFSRKFDYPVATYNFLVQGATTQATSARLAAAGQMDIEGATFNGLAGDNLAPGETVAIQIAGLPKSSSSQTVIWVVLTLIALGAAGGFMYLMKRRSLQTVSVESQPPDELRQQLLLEMARLDDDFESGKIEKEAYTRQRAEKKSQLLRLVAGSE
ncbi:MAG: hypothetical protein HYX80_05395 [Chloroflexi bacterium]|nr:hypothetical protein [Chloroflexota bacterium]